MSDLYPDRTALEEAIASLEARRALLGDALVDAALAPLRARLAAVGCGQQPATPNRRLRQVSVLFLDLVGSTALIQRMDPEDVQSVVDGALASFAALVRQHGGEVLRYAGDSLKAAFGADQAREDDAARAVACGLALLWEARRRGSALLQMHGAAGFDARVGIHTGPVVRGGGVEEGNSLTGLAVHIAARMEQAALPGTLRISMDTHRLVQGLVEAVEQPALQVKGLDGLVRTFVVQALRDRRLRGLRHGADGVTTAMIDRADELARLHQAVAAVSAPGAGLQAATVLGDAGLGKSRLLAELQAGLPATVQAGGLWRAAGHPQGLYQPYGLLRDLLFWQLGVRDSDSQDEAQQRFAAALRPLFGATADEQIALLGQLIGLDYSASPHIAGILDDSRQLQGRGRSAWVQCLSLHAARQPLVLVLDDLQWADDPSLDALDHLAAMAAQLPLLLVCAARPELLQRRPQWAAAWPTHQQLPLPPLTEAGSNALASALLARLASPVPALQSLLSAQAAGNPYYMEALLQMLVDTGVVQAEGEHWQVREDRLSDLKVPATLVGVLQATLDALDADQRLSLQQASVVGSQFWDEALAAIDPRAPEQLPALTRRDLALPQPQSLFDGACEYRFRHHLLHQVTYGTVLKPDRRHAHAQAARWLQARSQGRENELSGQIAEHFERAGEPVQALAYWLRAAEDACRREADGATLAHCDRALALDDGSDLHSLARLRTLRCVVFRRGGDAPVYEQEISLLETLAERLDDDDVRLSVAYHRAWRLSNQARYAEAADLMRDRLASAPRGAPREAARVVSMLFVCLARLGRHDEAMAQARHALALAKEAGDHAVVGEVHNYAGVFEGEANRLGSALEHYQQAQAAYEASGSLSGLVTIRMNRAQVEATLGRMAAARELLLQVIHDCRVTGNRRLEGMAQANLSGVLCELGDCTDAMAAVAEGLRLAALSGDSRTAAWAHNGARYVTQALRRMDDALAHAKAAEVGFRAHGDPFSAWIHAAAGAQLLQQLGRPAEALAAAEQLLAEIDANTGRWADAVEPAYLLHCALAPLGHPRAPELLATAHESLCSLADRMAEHLPREAFMRAFALHRAICDAWAAAHAGTAPASGASPQASECQVAWYT